MDSSDKCINCGTTGAELYKCSRCKKAKYCSKACQTMDWKFQHKTRCKRGGPIQGTHGIGTGFPQAMYRTENGAEWFMGIVCYNNMKLVKLDNPAGELNSPGHLMDDNEFFAECFHYDNFSQDEAIPPIKTEGFDLVDFSHKPHPYPDPEEARFDCKYPHGVPPPQNRRHVGPTPHIRRGDRVRLVSSRSNGERFWVKVWSVTAFGMVTGHVIDKLEYETGIGQGNLIAFKACKVLGVEHGENWK